MGWEDVVVQHFLLFWGDGNNKFVVKKYIILLQVCNQRKSLVEFEVVILQLASVFLSDFTLLV